MFRKVRLPSPSAVAAYAYCEDLLRPTTPEEEAYRMTVHLPAILKEKLLKLMKHRAEASVLRDLENTVRSHDFDEVDVPVKLVHFCWESGELSKEEIECVEPGIWPIVHVLTMDSDLYILYTTQMNYVDGYDPFTGEDNIPIIPDNLINSIRLSLRYRAIPRPRGSELVRPRTPRKSAPILPLSEIVVEQPAPVIEKVPEPQKPVEKLPVPELPKKKPPPVLQEKLVITVPPAKPSPRKTEPLKQTKETSSEEEDTPDLGELGSWKIMAENLNERSKSRDSCTECALI